MSPPHAQPTPDPVPSVRAGMETLDEVPGRDPAPPAAVVREGDALVGTVVDDRYQVIAKLAEGGMGRVYRAHHRNANRAVALKVLIGDYDPARREVREARFLREARVISRLAHPNVVQVYDFGVLPDGELYYVMELLAGRPLADLVFEHAPLPVATVVRLALQMAEGLRAAHAQAIVHRDLKPENVIVVEDGGDQVAKVVDFGIAKILGDTGKKLTRTGIVTGTPHYISPEQAQAGELDHRSDIYSFGVMLYEMAVGELPFEVGEGSWVALLDAHIRQPPPPPSARGVDIGPLEGIILRCLAKDPAERFQSMDELIAALRHPASFAASSSPSALPWKPPFTPTLESRHTTPAPPVRRHGRFVLGAGTMLLTLILAAGAWWALPSDRPEPSARPGVSSPAPPPEPSVPSPAPVVESPAHRREPPTPAGPVTHLTSAPPGAEVTVDGVVIGNTPLDIPLPAEGTQQLRLVLPGHSPVEHELTADTPAGWTLTLRRRPPPSPSAPRAPVEESPVPEAPAAPPPLTERQRVAREELLSPWD